MRYYNWIGVEHHREAGFEHLLYSLPSQRAGIQFAVRSEEGAQAEYGVAIMKSFSKI